MLLVVVSAGNALATTYSIVELPLPPSTTGGAALDISATGDVVGTVDSFGGRDYAVAWSAPDYAMRVLPSEDATQTTVAAISDAGNIIGTANFPGAASQPVMWKSDGTLVRMAKITRRGYLSSVADINTRGTVVGRILGPEHERPAIWTMPLTLRILRVASPGSGSGAEATAVNDWGTVVGYGPVVGGSATHAFRWTTTDGMQDLGDLPGGSDTSIAYDVNDGGQVVGTSWSESGGRAVLWNADGSMLDLGILPGDDGHLFYEADDINNLGVVIGRTSGDDVIHFLWTAGSGMLRIVDVIDPADPWYPQLQSGEARIYVYDLNDPGVIVGALYKGGATTVPVMLVPQSCTGVPEPQASSHHRGASAAMQGTGCL